MVFGYNNILHFMDIFKVPLSGITLVQHVSSECGYRQIMHDITIFCDNDLSRCTTQTLLSNFYWRAPIIALQSFRVFVNWLQLAVYTSKKNQGVEEAVEWMQDTMFDMGEDLGSISNFILDFHLEQGIHKSEWDH